MGSKKFLLLALAFAAVLLITSEVDAARNLASNHDRTLLQYPTNPPPGSCKFGRCCDYVCKCCSTLEEAAAYKQAQKTQTHN